MTVSTHKANLHSKTLVHVSCVTLLLHAHTAGLLEPNSNPSMDGLLLLDISGQPPKVGESLVAGPGSANGK
jgi:hypothetical protein